MNPNPRRRRTGWDYSKKNPVRFTYGGLSTSSEELAPGETHWHFWLPGNGDQENLRIAMEELQAERGPISHWSWDWIPEGR